MAIYNPKSLIAEEFINDEEIRATLEYAQANKDNVALIDEILQKARPQKTETGYACAGLTHREASVLLSCLRLIYPQVLLPATTALASLGQDGRQRGLLAGANVVMPNLSPQSVRNKYALYNNKKSSGSESAQQICKLQTLVESIGMTLHSGKGDRKDWNNGNL